MIFIIFTEKKDTPLLKFRNYKSFIFTKNYIIFNEAKIYRLFNNKINIEIYSKEEFIRMLTIPTNSLKRTEILEKEIKNGKITNLKFIVK